MSIIALNHHFSISYASLKLGKEPFFSVCCPVVTLILQTLRVPLIIREIFIDPPALYHLFVADFLSLKCFLGSV
jgi:hypothetical protein